MQSGTWKMLFWVNRLVSEDYPIVLPGVPVFIFPVCIFLFVSDTVHFVKHISICLCPEMVIGVWGQLFQQQQQQQQSLLVLSNFGDNYFKVGKDR
jgi:hypothetical protein